MTIRLSKDTRARIANAAVMAAFKDRKAALLDAEHDLAQEVWEHITPTAVRALLAKLPSEWKSAKDGVHVRTATGFRLWLEFDSSKPLPLGNHYAHQLDAGELSDRVEAHATSKEKLNEEHKAARRATLGMLNAFPNVKKLAEGWPEGIEFYREFLERAPETLPTVRTDEVNALLGITNAVKGDQK